MPDDPVLTVKTHLDAEKIVDGIRKITKQQVLVGIPAENDARGDGSGIGNAVIGYINEFGSPLQGIPARAHLVPGTRKVLPEITNHLKAALTAAMEGRAAQIEPGLRRAGQTAVNSVRSTITDKIPPPLAPATVAARRIRSKGSKYRRKAATASQTTPLYDTGNYIRHITYVIRRKK
jgi:hypothetical protein